MRDHGRHRLLASLILAASALAARPAAAAVSTVDLAAMVDRINFFMQRHEVDGVTRETRVLPNEPEEVRLSVIPQLLAYVELKRAAGWRGYDADIIARADFLIAHQSSITSGTAFDGMLGDALIAAWEATGRVEYRDAALPILQRCLVLSGQQMTLNWGLMGAMALARWYRLTGDESAELKTATVLQSLHAWQNADGSFPHFCIGTKDMHYTSWMTQELLLVRAQLAHPAIEPLLEGTRPFLEAHVGPQGEPFYEMFCTHEGGCAEVLYSRGGGCNDYDTRGWVNELGYLLVALEGRDTGVQDQVWSFLRSLERDGGFRDKWSYHPLPGDPIYVWATGDPSVIRTSVLFWSLASLLRQRGVSPIAVIPPPSEPRPPREGGPPSPCDSDPAARTPVLRAAAADRTSPFLDGRRLALLAEPDCPGAAGEAVATPPAALTLGTVVARPGRGLEIGFFAARGAPIRLSIHDVAGRAIAGVEAQASAGSNVIRWDGRTQTGTPVPPGAYFIRLRSGDAVARGRVVVVR